ncbi:hypothetical protein D3C77_244010 [compost metagenome]
MGKDGLPGVFGVTEDRGNELGLLIIGRGGLAGAGGDRRRLLLIHLPSQLAKDLQWVLAGDPANADDQQDRTYAQALATAEAHAATTLATGIDHIVATPAFSPLHECSPELGNTSSKISSPDVALSDSCSFHNHLVMYRQVLFNVLLCLHAGNCKLACHAQALQ